jgi:hypothetical protein
VIDVAGRQNRKGLERQTVGCRAACRQDNCGLPSQNRSPLSRLKLAVIVSWIQPRQARLGRLTPIEFETIMNTAVALAA